MQKKRVSKNVEDIRTPLEKAKHETKVDLGGKIRSRLSGSDMLDRATDILNMENALIPEMNRGPRAAKPAKTVPKGTGKFSGSALPKGGRVREVKKTKLVPIQVTPGKWKTNLKAMSDTFKSSVISTEKKARVR